MGLREACASVRPCNAQTCAHGPY